MATQRSFQEMLNQYLPNKLLREEMMKRDYFLQNVEKDNTWLGGDLIVPFRAAGASTVKFGGLTASGDIGQSKNVRGSITKQPEAWGSLIFNERDLMEHGKISEQNLLKLLPDEIEDFLDYMKMVVSLSFTNGPAFATVMVNGDASGLITVDRPERFQVGQKVIFLESTGALSTATGFVDTVNMETGELHIVTTRFGAISVDLSAIDVAEGAKAYFDGNETAGNRLTSLKLSLLPAAHGGGSTLYGVTKLNAPYTQSIWSDGSGINATNILDKAFDHMVKMRNRAAGKADKMVVSYKHWGSIQKILETSKGPFRQASDLKASIYGWDEIDIGSPRGKITVVATQEMDDDWIAFLDLSAMKIYSNGFFKKRESPEGKTYFEIRAEDGFQYIVDLCFFGDMVLERPNRCGIMSAISY